jgi:predicted metal-dependent hydrolase
MDARPVPHREIPVRRPDLPFDDSIPRHWFGGNPFLTHFFNGLNLVFPEGERFFIKAVRDHQDRIDDPALAAQLRGFFGQEGRHAHEHERYFEVLRAQGYRIDGYLRRFERFLAWKNRHLSPRLRLAITAGAEHWTATLGTLALTEERIDQAHPTMRRLLLWHALEELEHKAVAFDVLRLTGGGYAMRMLGFAIATLGLFAWAFAGTRMLLAQDGISRRERRAILRATRAQDGGRFPRTLARGVRAYLRPSFHPDQIDDRELLARRLPEIGWQPAS